MGCESSRLGYNEMRDIELEKEGRRDLGRERYGRAKVGREWGNLDEKGKGPESGAVTNKWLAWLALMNVNKKVDKN